MKDKTDQYDSLQQKMEWQKLQLDEEKLQFGEQKQQLELQIKAKEDYSLGVQMQYTDETKKNQDLQQQLT